jgi:CRP-like cAMP-binding protein
MKRLLDRLKGAGRGDRSEGDGDGGEESGFFSTMFLDRHEDTQLLVNWVARRLEVNAQPFEREEGARLFGALWGQDRHAAALGPDALTRMSAYMEFVAVPAKQEVIGQDEQGDYMLVVLEGVVAVDRVQPWGGRARLAEARAGDMLGEMSLLDAGARFSACVTLTPCILGVLEAKSLDRLVEDDPRLALALLASMSRRLSLRLRQVSARLGALLSRE